MNLTDRNLPVEQINEMEERRIALLDESGIDERAVLGKANENLNTWNSYFNENIVRGKDDVNFVIRDQWTAVERNEFTRLFKPAMTFNKLYDPIKKVVGEQRKNKPDLLVRSLTGKAKQEQLNLRADLVRTISYQSQNDLVYQTAFKSALMMGYGAFMIELDYESPMSFNQTIRYRLINDATRTAFDPTATKPHKGDGDWCSISYLFRRDQFDATFPYVTNPVSFVDPYMLLDFQWQTKDTIVVCNYYSKEWFPLVIFQLSNGEVVTEDEWKKREKKFENNKEYFEDKIVGEIIAREIPTIVNKRQTQDYRIMQYQMIQNQILDFTEWPSKHLPIVFVDGDSYYIEGRQYTKSYIHEARDAQKCVNYLGSEIISEVKNRRKEQWVATPDNIEGYEQQWRNPELQMGALMARPDPKTGSMPQKMPAWDLSGALMQNFQRASQDIREIVGFSEQEQLMGRDISGKARRERKTEGGMSAYVFFDNLNQAIEQAGRVVLDLLPVIYGGNERNVIISQKDGSSRPITLNRELPSGQIENKLEAGEYDIEIDTGPSFAVQKEIALEFLQQTIAANPQTFPLIADLWAKNLDVQFMPQIAERFKTLVPKEILEKEAGLPPSPPQPNPQAQMMQMAQQIQKAQLEERAEELRIRREKHEIEKAELVMKAREMSQKMQLENERHGAELQKADLDFTAKIAKILSDTDRL